MATKRTAAQILAEWIAGDPRPCPPGVRCEHGEFWWGSLPDCAACWLAAAERRAKASEEATPDGKDPQAH